MVTPRYHPYPGGVETHVKAIAERLVQAGVEVDVFTTDPGRRLSRVVQVNGVTVRRFPSWAPHEAYYVSPWHLVSLARRAQAFDLVHAHSYQALTCLNGALAAGGKRPFVFTPHYHGRGETVVRNLVHLPWRIPGRWLFGRAHRVICVSAAERARLRQHFPHARAIIIPNGVRLDGLRAAVSRPRDREGGPVILYVGRLERYKNVDRLIACVPYLPADYRLIIVGSGPHKQELLQQIGRLSPGHRGRVQITSGIADEEVFGWYKTCGICVNLSGSEAFGLTLLEALAAGKPVLANDIPAFREISALSPLVHLVHLCRLDDAGLARALLSAMARSGSPPDLSAYTWDEVARWTLGVYREVLGEVRA
jgi:glycosyltransferase involved in cell wall biosynthesis